MGVIFPLENNLWLATLAGTNRDYPPDDDAGFLEFARGLAQPDLFEAIREAKPVSGIYGYRYAENRLRHFDRVKRSPEGFVALGDAVCQFNPIYGQGMSVAAIGAPCSSTAASARSCGGTPIAACRAWRGTSSATWRATCGCRG